MSIKKIAELAGVSISTVSNVMNGTGRVSKKTAALIKKIASAENLEIRQKRPNAKSRKMRVGFSQVDGVTSVRYSPFAMQIMAGVRATLEEEKHSLIVLSRLTEENIERETKDIDGLILQGHAEKATRFSARVDKPITWVGWDTEYFLDCIVADERGVSKLAAEYFLSRGHKCVGYLDDTGIPGIGHRGVFFSEYLIEGGCKAIVVKRPGIFTIKNGDPVVDSGLIGDMLDHMLARKNKPTGIFSAGDIITQHIYNHLRRRGIRPVQDMDILSCNNERILIDALDPMPAVIDIGLYEIGRMAVHNCLWRLNHPGEISMKVLVRPRLIQP